VPADVPYRILCAYDHSAGAQKAFAFALDLALRYSGELHVLAVFEPAEASRGVKSEALAETARHQFSTAFDEVNAKAAAAGVQLTTAVGVGSPAQQIIRYSEEVRADHIVVGQRGKNSHERSIVGSVSLRVVTHGTGPATVVR
jgi:nucleotide-binding universal stress UspA family protein